MTEPVDPRDPFEILRSSARGAAVPSASHVRELGRRRQVRARVVAVVGSVVLLTSGIGVAAAVSDRGGPAPVTQGGDVTATPSTTAVPSTIPTPSPQVTTLRPPPSPSGGVVPSVPPSPSPVPIRSLRPPTTPRTTVPVTPPPILATTGVPTTRATIGTASPGSGPATTQPPTRTTPPTVEPALHIVLTRTSPAGSPDVTYRAVVTGTVWQAHTRSGQPVTGSGEEQITGTTVRVDGVDVGGSDGGDLVCSKTAIVAERSTWTPPSPIVLTPGSHELMFQIRSCLEIAETDITVVVS